MNAMPLSSAFCSDTLSTIADTPENASDAPLCEPMPATLSKPVGSPLAPAPLISFAAISAASLRATSRVYKCRVSGKRI